MKKLVVLVLVAAVVGGLVWLAARGNSERAQAATRGERTAPVERRNISVAVAAIGEISPANQVTVKTEVSGRIKEILARTGQAVARGEPLLTLDDTDLLTEQDAALTDIARARVQLDKADRDYRRLQELHASELVSREAFDNAVTTLALSSNDFTRAGKTLQSVEDKLKKIRLLAPFNGTVLNILVSEGQVVSGAAGVNAGTDLMTFADLNQMIIRAHINQVDITRLERGQEALVTVDSLRDTRLAGEIVLIAPVATVVNNIKGFSVDVLITRADPRVRPGMNANLRFPVVNREDALGIPLSAVFVEDGEKVVYVAHKGAPAERRPVTVGVADHRHAEILAGLSEGEIVLLERPAAPPA